MSFPFLWLFSSSFIFSFSLNNFILVLHHGLSYNNKSLLPSSLYFLCFLISQLLFCLACLYFFFTFFFFFFQFQFRNIYYLFRAKKSWGIHLPLLHGDAISISMLKMEKLGQKSGLLWSHTQRGKETTCRCGAEVKTSHSFYPFSIPYFLGQAV